MFVLGSRTAVYMHLPLLLPVTRILNGVVTMEMCPRTVNILLI